MKKRAIDLSFDELTSAGQTAAEAAIAESHSAGLVTLGTQPNGQFLEVHPDGNCIVRPRHEIEAQLLSARQKSIRRSSAA